MSGHCCRCPGKETMLGDRLIRSSRFCSASSRKHLASGADQVTVYKPRVRSACVPFPSSALHSHAPLAQLPAIRHPWLGVDVHADGVADGFKPFSWVSCLRSHRKPIKKHKIGRRRIACPIVFGDSVYLRLLPNSSVLAGVTFTGGTAALGGVISSRGGKTNGRLH